MGYCYYLKQYPPKTQDCIGAEALAVFCLSPLLIYFFQEVHI